MSASNDLVHQFAEFAAHAGCEKIPAVAVEAAKKSILDTLGVILAASGVEPAVRGVVDFVTESGGRPESQVFGFGGRVPAAMAAFANGAMAHCLDFDDQTPWGQHASSSIVPAALAVAERRGGVSGRDVISAVAAGQDIFARLRCNVGWRKDWNLSTVIGVFSATAAAGRVVGLSPTEMANAFGIASMHSCGIMQVVSGIGSDLRGMYAGFSAKGAVVSTLLAERGIAGVDDLFEGQDGFFRTYFDGKYDRAKILEGLGEEYKGGYTLYKRWPAVGTAHSHMHAAIELVIENDLRLADIAEIRVYVGDYHELMCTPLPARRAPATPVDAKFSLPFLVATAVVRRDVSFSDLTVGSLGDPDVLAAARLVVPIVDRNLDWKLELPPGRVEIVTRDGRKLERVGTKVPGNPEAPMSWSDLSRKFGECAAAAASPLSAGTIEEVSRLVQHLEDVDDVSKVLRLLEHDSR